MYWAGPVFVAKGEALEPDYDGTLFTPKDMKHVVQNFYQSRHRFDAARRVKPHEDVKMPRIFETGWVHPKNDTSRNIVGETRHMFVDENNRLIVIGRTNAATIKGREISERLKGGKTIGLSGGFAFKALESGNDSRITSKFVTEVSFVDQPAHHASGTYVEHVANTEAEILAKVFGTSSSGAATGGDDDGLSTTTKKRPVFISRALRGLVQKTLDRRLPSNALPVETGDDTIEESDPIESVADKKNKNKGAPNGAKEKEDDAEKEEQEADDKGEHNVDAMDIDGDSNATPKEPAKGKATEGDTQKETEQSDAMDIDTGEITSQKEGGGKGKGAQVNQQKPSADAVKKPSSNKESVPAEQNQTPADAKKNSVKSSNEKNANPPHKPSKSEGDAVFDDTQESMRTTEKRKSVSSSSSAQVSSKASSVVPKKSNNGSKGMSGNNNNNNNSSNTGNQPAGGKAAGNQSTGNKPAGTQPGAAGKSLQQTEERRAVKRPLQELMDEEEEDPQQEAEQQEEAMDIDQEEEGQRDSEPRPPANNNNNGARTLPPRRNVNEDGGGKSARNEKKASPSAYKLTNNDLKQQLSAGREVLDELSLILGINTDEQRDAFVQAALREKLQEAAAEQRAITASLHQLAAEAGVDEETLKSFDAAASDMVNGKGLNATNGREMGKFLAAVANRFGSSSAMSHPLLEAEYQRKKQRSSAAPARDEGDDEYEPRERSYEAKAGSPFTFGLGGNMGGGGGGGKTLDLSNSPWASKFFNQNFFSSGAFSNAGHAIKKGANTPGQNAFRSAPQYSQQQQHQQGVYRQNKARGPQIPEGFVMPSGRRNARVSSDEDAMEIDSEMARRDEDDELRNRIESLTQDHGFKYRGKHNVKQFVSSLPKDLAGYRPDTFDFDTMAEKITPNGWNHHLVTAIMYPDHKRLGANPAAREVFTEQSSFYNRADPPPGYLPRIIHGNKPLIVAEEDKE